jgi:arylsulfatase A-like enzyme
LSRTRLVLVLVLLAGLLAAFLAGRARLLGPEGKPSPGWLFAPPIAETGTLDLKSLGGAVSMGFSGLFDGSSSPAVWALGPESRVPFTVLEPRPLELDLELIPAPGTRLLSVGVSWNGTQLWAGDLLEGRWHSLQIRIPAELELLGSNWLLLRHAAGGGTGGPSARRAAYRRIELRPASGLAVPLVLDRAVVELAEAATPSAQLPPGVRRRLLEIDAGPAPPGSSLGAGAVQALLLRESENGRVEPFPLPAASTRRPPEPLLHGSAVRRVARSAVVILLDACRADFLGAYGDPSGATPNLDRLARRSVSFARTFSAASYTLASVGTLLSGIPSLATGLIAADRRLPPDVSTLPETLSKDGFTTAAFAASPYVGPAFGLDRGFEKFVEFSKDQQYGREGRRATRVVAAFSEWLAARPREERIFAYVHLREPHQPYDPRAPLDRLFLPAADASEAKGTNSWIMGLDAGTIPARPEDIAHIEALYRGGLAAADEAVGRLLQGLADSGRLDSTLVLLVADHGEAFFEHQRMSHNSTIYDEMIHVPWLLAFPGAVEADGSIEAGLAATVDMAPTLAEALGVALPQALPGTSRLAVLRGQALPSAAVFSHDSERALFAALRTGRFKLIDNERGEGGRLFDVLADPLEERDLSGRLPVTHSLLELWLQGFLAERRQEREHRGRMQPEPLDPATQEEIRALGYVE